MYFWDKERVKMIIKQRKKCEDKIKAISAIAVWTEIISTIKG
jgi:hypothetical protein